MKAFFLAALLLPACYAALRDPRLQGFARNHALALHRAARLFAALLIVSVVLGGLVAVFTERIRFYEEATILSIAAAFHHGQPLYTPAGAPAEYSLLYGPITFFAYLPPLLLGAQRLQGYEAWSLIALALTFTLVFLTLRRPFGITAALANTALAAALVVRLAANVWAIKADVWILLFAALAFFAAARLRPRAAALVLAIAGASLVDLKITLLLVALLPCLLLAQRSTTRHTRLPALLAALAIPLLSLVPFALPGVSFRTYLPLLLQYSHRDLAPLMLRLNLAFTLLLLLPTLALLWAALHTSPAPTRAWLRSRTPYLALLAAACLVAILTGAKIGGGPWHCLVLILPCLPLNAELWSLVSAPGTPSLWRNPRAAAPVLAVSCALFIAAWPALVTALKERLHDPPGDTPVSMRAIEDDLLDISQRYPHTVLQMGYAGRAQYNLTFPRSILQIRGNPLLLDANTRNEEDLIGRPVPPALIDAITHCSVQLWIIPRGSEPFSMTAPYFMDPAVDRTRMAPDLYSPSFRRIFLAHHRNLHQPTPFFDLWACVPNPPPGSPLPISPAPPPPAPVHAAPRTPSTSAAQSAAPHTTRS